MAGYELLITTDKKLMYQQNLLGRKIAMIALGQANWPVVENHISQIMEAVNAVTMGSYVLIEM